MPSQLVSSTTKLSTKGSQGTINTNNGIMFLAKFIISQFTGYLVWRFDEVTLKYSRVQYTYETSSTMPPKPPIWINGIVLMAHVRSVGVKIFQAYIFFLFFRGLVGAPSVCVGTSGRAVKRTQWCSPRRKCSNLHHHHTTTLSHNNIFTFFPVRGRLVVVLLKH